MKNGEKSREMEREWRHFFTSIRGSHTSFTPLSIFREWECDTLFSTLYDLQRSHSLKIENGHFSPLEVKNGNKKDFVEDFFIVVELNFTLRATFLLLYYTSFAQVLCVS